MTTVIHTKSTKLKGLQSVLQFMAMAELRVAQLQFGEGGGVLRGVFFKLYLIVVGVKPGSERMGVTMEYLVVTASENEKYIWLSGLI